jgi:hypothetical protein
MDKVVSRITVVRGRGDRREAIEVYRGPKKSRRKSSGWLARIEDSVGHLLKANAIATQDAYRRHLNSGKSDGWLRNAPTNVTKAVRKGYKEARKAVPLRLSPKAR